MPTHRDVALPGYSQPSLSWGFAKEWTLRNIEPETSHPRLFGYLCPAPSQRERFLLDETLLADDKRRLLFVRVALGLV